MEIKASIEIIIEDLRECETYSKGEKYNIAMNNLEHASALIKELWEELLLEINK